jgi:transcriptional regulator with XRE-family HTH domain
MAMTPVESKLRAAMAGKGVRQSDLAALLGITQAQISARIRGTIEWRVSELQAVARHLGVPVTELIDEPADTTPAAAAS